MKSEVTIYTDKEFKILGFTPTSECCLFFNLLKEITQLKILLGKVLKKKIIRLSF